MEQMERLRSIYHSGVPEPLLRLSQTAAMTRLRDVGMNCGCEYTAYPRFALCGAYSRHTHSLGVGLIVWHFTGELKQAAAGLLHDVSTPVFAHVVDFLRGDYLRQEATEDGTRELIEASGELQALLRTYGLGTDEVCDYHRYPIADNDSPRLSADRLEYTLGNALQFGFAELPELAELYADLAVGKNEDGDAELCFRTPRLALRFAELALRCGRVYVCDEDRYSMQRLSELLRSAMESGVLTERDLLTTEPEVVARLNDSALSAKWRAYRALREIRRQSTPGEIGAWRRIPAKKRYIDPFVLCMGRTTALFPAFRAELEAFLREPQDEWLCGG